MRFRGVFWAVWLLVVSVPAFARHGGAASGSSPFYFPALSVTQAQGMFKFLGSVTIPDGASATGNIYIPGGALYTADGSHMYVAGMACDPGVANCGTISTGIGEVTLPATVCSGYVGGSTCTATVDSPPIGPGIVATTSYALTSGYSAGDTCAVFSSALPPGISANNGWYIFFGAADDDLVTSVGSCGGADSVGWATALTATYASPVNVYQWAPTQPWGGGGQNYITGSYVSGGSLIITAVVGYDAACTSTLGFSLQASSSALSPSTTWGSINDATIANNPWGYVAPESSRALVGPIVANPSIWQPYFGAAAVVMGESQSIASCMISQGPAFFSLNPADITAAGANVPVTAALAYTTTHGMSGQPPSGPFPLTTTTGYYPATLSAAPVQGAASVTVSLPTTSVTLTANVPAIGNQIDVTAISGTLSNSAIAYTANDTAAVFPANCCAAFTSLAYDYAPGSTLGTGTYNLGNPSTAAATNDTITLTPAGYNIGSSYEMFFSDGSSAVGTFAAASSGVQVFTPTAPLTGCVPATPCTTAVQIAPMGRAWNTGYDGPLGTGFWVPNTSTWVALSFHLNGPQNGRGSSSVCDGGASESYSTPLAPDTTSYGALSLYLYSASALLKGYNGSQAPYVASPYDVISFPDSANVLYSNGCPSSNQYNNGFADYYAAGNILYIIKGNVLLEYQITPP